jgi:predicted nuclease with TOPRIM domain
MWTDEKQERYDSLRGRQQMNELTAAEGVELDDLIQELDDREAAYLTASSARKGEEIAELATRVKRLEAENSQLREYLRERHAFLERVKSLVAEIEAEDREMRRRFDAVSDLPHGHTPSSRS